MIQLEQQCGFCLSNSSETFISLYTSRWENKLTKKLQNKHKLTQIYWHKMFCNYYGILVAYAANDGNACTTKYPIILIIAHVAIIFDAKLPINSYVCL